MHYTCQIISVTFLCLGRSVRTRLYQYEKRDVLISHISQQIKELIYSADRPFGQLNELKPVLSNSK